MPVNPAVFRRRRREDGGSDPFGEGNTALVAALGDANILAFYDVRKNVTTSGGVVTAWDDCRATSGYGPQIAFAGSARPAFTDGSDASKLITADGVDDYGASAASALFNLGVDISIAFVGTVESGDTAVNISNGTRFLRIKNTTGNIAVGSQGTEVSTAVATSTTRRLVMAGWNADSPWDVKGEVPDHAVQALTDAAMTAGNNELRLLSFGAGVAPAVATLRAVIVLNRSYTAGDVTTIKAWAQTYHNITLAA